MIKLSLMVSLLLIFAIGCKDDSSTSPDETSTNTGSEIPVPEVQDLYSVTNSLNINANDMEPTSYYGYGECEISNGEVIYKKTDSSYTQDDYCVPNSNLTPFDCGEPSYKIDFSLPEPELVPKVGKC